MEGIFHRQGADNEAIVAVQSGPSARPRIHGSCCRWLLLAGVSCFISQMIVSKNSKLYVFNFGKKKRGKKVIYFYRSGCSGMDSSRPFFKDWLHRC